MKNKISEFLVPSLLAIILTLTLIYVALEPPAVVNFLLRSSFYMPDFRPNTELEENFIRTYYIRPIGYSCLAVIVFFIVLGFVTEKKRLTSTGTIIFFLPIFGSFAGHMFFLSGLGILRIFWLPFWGGQMRLGNIVYLPYMIIVYPFTLIGVKIGMLLSLLIVGLGFLLLLSSMQTWLRAKYQGRELADSWIYRFSRHPQYLGWIVWSYGLMLYAFFNRKVAMGGENLGGSLPWAITSLIIVCVALAEEIKMKRTLGEEYDSYQKNTPFMFPLPKYVSALIKAPLKLVIKKSQPENRKELLVTFMIYLVIIIVLSLPFLIFGIPGNRSVFKQFVLNPF